MKPTVILTSYNRLDYLKRTINSLFDTLPKFNLIIVDNASTDPAVKEYLEGDDLYNRLAVRNTGRVLDDDDGYLLILNHKNEGWGSAVNFALARLKDQIRLNPTKWNQEFILLSNNDVEYKDGWFETLVDLYRKYPQVGIMAVWKHTAHGILKDHGDLIVKDQMPAVGWLFQSHTLLEELVPFPEHGPCETKGGNGEDVTMCIKAEQKGLWVAAPKEDVAIHIDGY